MHRKGSSELVLFILFAFILVAIVGGGIFLGVQIFYGESYEMRLVESQILASRIERCLETNDFFEEGFSISVCGLLPNSFDNRLAYVKRISDQREWFTGVYDFINQCPLGEKNDAYPKCTRGSVVKEGITYEYIAGSNYEGYRI